MCAVLLSSSPALRNGCSSRADRGGAQAAACWPTAGPGAGPCEAHAPGRPQASSYGRRVGDVDGARPPSHAPQRRAAAKRGPVASRCRRAEDRHPPAYSRAGGPVRGGVPRSARGQAFSRSHRTCGAAHRAQVRSGREPPVSPQQVADRRARGSRPPGRRWQVGGQSPRAPKPLGAGNRVQEGEARPSPASRPAQG